MTPSIHALEKELKEGKRKGRKTRSPQARIDAFMRAHRFPLVEGSLVTFAYCGEADEVYLQHWIYGLPNAQPFRRIDGTCLWYLMLELPSGSRIEYKLDVVNKGNHKLILDPLNPLQAHDPFGSNSVLHAAGYETPVWAVPNPEAPSGQLEELVLPSQALGDERKLQLYLPARFRQSRRYPLLVVHDGSDYLRYSALQTVLDNLIHRLEIAPMIVALTDPVDRLKEYANHDPHARFLTEELVPYLEERYPIESLPSMRGLMGASFGAVAALSTAWRYRGVYDRLLLQSGSFAFTDIGHHDRPPEFDPVVDFVNAFRDAPKQFCERVFVSCGVYESLVYENRSLVPLLQETGMQVRYDEARDGHNWENWRDRLRDALSWLFPGPLWMVYE